MNNHDEIKLTLRTMVETHNVPNILFYGDYCVGKSTILEYLLSLIYETRDRTNNVMDVNCATGKGIKFVREELKTFAQMNTDEHFKSVILRNMDYLTMEAQSALRRCIEVFSSNTRFFVIVRYKERLLKPILSRFALMYISYPHLVINGELTTSTGTKKSVNKYVYNYYYLKKMPILKQHIKLQNRQFIKKMIQEGGNPFKQSRELYEKGICCRDIIKYIETVDDIPDKQKTNITYNYYKNKKSIRHDALIMADILAQLRV
jgi:hypothetical protein